MSESKVLSRKSILSGAYLEAFAGVPEDILWSLEKIDASLGLAMKSRPAKGEVWLFGYGSLIWNPLFEYVSRERATLHGWHRSFCLRTIGGRGTAEAPGRMLSLEPGGFTVGVALRLPKESIDDELRMIWIREMVTGAYSPTWADVTLVDERKIKALVFVADPSHPYHESNSDVSHIAPLISAASGPIGTNVDYVRKLQSSLLNCNMPDPYVNALAAELDRLSAAKNA
jgi:cation transport protein ChaC